MFTLSAITGAFYWLASNAWALLLIAAPAILGWLQPLLAAIVGGISQYLTTFWEGLKSMKFSHWLVVFTIGAILFGVGYYYGWQACIDWVHAHFRLYTKVKPSSWWKFW